MKFFRKWREKRREAIAQQWIAEKISLPPVEVPKLDVDEDALERWRQEQAVLRPAPGPTVVLNNDTDDIEQQVQDLLTWQAQTAPWLKEILASHRDSLRFLEGQRIRTVRQLQVMETVLDALIFTHSRPDWLLLNWQHQVPALIDRVGDDLPPDLAQHHAEDALAWQAVVKHYTQLIERVADHFEKHHTQGDDE